MSRTSIFGFGDQGNTVIRTSYMDSPLRFELKTRAPETLVLPLHHGEMFTSSEPPQASKSFSESSEGRQSPQSSCRSLEASDNVPLEPQYRLTYTLLLSLRTLPYGASTQIRTERVDRATRLRRPLRCPFTLCPHIKKEYNIEKRRKDLSYLGLFCIMGLILS